MIYRVTHRTLYEYSEPVTISHHAARVEPRTTPTQHLERWDLQIDPEPAVLRSRDDYFGNRLCFFSVQELHQRLEIVAHSVVRLDPGPLPDPKSSPPWERVVEGLREPEPSDRDALNALQFSFESPHVRPSRDLAAWAAPSFPPGRPLLLALTDLNRRIHREFTFDPAATTVSTPLEEVLRQRRGVCQDFTHLALGCLRSLGLAGRYVSGYLRTYRKEDARAFVGADVSHAWFSAFCPGYGWIDFDPTNNLLPRLEHIALAYGRDFSDVSPVTGMIVGGGKHEILVAVTVEPASEPPAPAPAHG